MGRVLKFTHTTWYQAQAGERGRAASLKQMLEVTQVRIEMEKIIFIELSFIRELKNLTLIPLVIFFSCVVSFFILKILGTEEWFLPFYQMSFFPGIFGFLMSFVKSDIKCPNCEKTFNKKEKLEEISGMRFSTWAFSVLARKCMNCGIMLSGKNINEYSGDS